MFEVDGILMDCGEEMNKLIPVLVFILCGCPKHSSDGIDIIEEERKEKLRELIEQEDESFDSIPEAGESDEDLPDND